MRLSSFVQVLVGVFQGAIGPGRRPEATLRREATDSDSTTQELFNWSFEVQTQPSLEVRTGLRPRQAVGNSLCPADLKAIFCSHESAVMHLIPVFCCSMATQVFGILVDRKEN